MASIVDSFRETLEDRYAIIKIILLAVPVYFAYDAFLLGNKDNFITLTLLSIILLFGTLIKTASNILNEADTVLPSWNIFLLVISAAKGLVAVGPVAAVSIYLGIIIVPNIHIVEWLDVTFAWIIWIVIASIILTSLLLFVKNEKIKDAYNLKFISEKAGDLIVGVVFLVLQVIVVNVITTGLIGYTILVLFGECPLFYFFLAMAIVYNTCVVGHYLAQLQYEVAGKSQY